MAKSFDDLRSGRVNKRGLCRRCRQNQTVGRVQVGIQSYSDASRPGRMVVSRSFSLCEECSVAVYEAALATAIEVYGRDD